MTMNWYKQLLMCIAQLRIGSLLICGLLATSLMSQEVPSIQFGAFEYDPFYWEETGQIRGIAAELAQDLAQQLNLQARITMYPLPRALFYLEHGRIDGMMGLIQTPERANYLAYSDPVIIVHGLIWSLADGDALPIEFEQLEDLRPYVTGITRGYSYGKEFDEVLQVMKVDVADSDYLNFQKLIARRIDIFPGNEIVAKGLIKKHPELKGRFVHSAKAFIEWELHMTVSKQSPLVERMPEINRIIAAWKQQGRIDQLIKKYTE